MRTTQLLPSTLVIALLAGCSGDAPPCPISDSTLAPANAGCFIIDEGRLLVIRDQTSKLSIPGGGKEAGESPQCTAHRETWEETGLDVTPTDLVAVFDNGFHLFNCTLHEGSGEVDPPLRFEVQEAFWLAPEDFQQHQWRYPEQAESMARRIFDAQSP